MTGHFNHTKTSFNLDMLFQLNGLSCPRISPDGKQVVFVITTSNLSRNCRKDHIALLTIDDKRLRLLTEGTSPSWSPGGVEIAYEYAEGGQSGIWIFNLAENKKKFLTPVYHSDYFIDHLERKGFAWSPDGRYIAYLSALRFAAADAQKDVRVINRLLYKTKGGNNRPSFTDDYLTHIWVKPVSGGEAEIITPGSYNEHSISWSPGSSQIAFISNRSADPDNNQRSDLWTVDIKTKEVCRLTEGPGSAFQPAWSPLGNFIAYLATTSVISTNDSLSDDTHLYLVPSGSGDPRCVTKALDRRIENICWHPNGKFIHFTAGNEGATPLYRVALSSGQITPVLNGNFHLMEYSSDPEGNDIVFVRTDIPHPPELFLFRENDPDPVRLTHRNDYTFQNAETCWFKSFDETPVQGWMMPPAGFNPALKHPLILVIHGGPHNMFGYEFEERMQLLSSEGYAVLFINPRGSSGYGQSFSNGCLMNWGGGDYKDLMTGLDYVIEKYDWIDRNRLGVTGQSYGGYMANWIITQTPRFKAAVVDGGISNLISFAGTSIYHSLIESEFNGPAYDNFSLLWQWSPLRNVKNVTAPTLFLHGANDMEVPISQAEEMYVALKKCGVKTTLVQYEGEGHGWRPDLKPKNRYDLYSRMVQWFSQYLNK